MYCAGGFVRLPSDVALVVALAECNEARKYVMSVEQARTLRNQLTGLLNACRGHEKVSAETKLIDRTADSAIVFEYLRPRRR